MAIEKIEDLELPKFKADYSSSKQENEEKTNALYAKINEALGTSVPEMKCYISDWVRSNSTALAKKFPVIAPYNDYSKMIEEQLELAEFISKECIKYDTWYLKAIQLSDMRPNLIQFSFSSGAVDDGDALTGNVFVSFNGVVKHVFANAE